MHHLKKDFTEFQKQLIFDMNKRKIKRYIIAQKLGCSFERLKRELIKNKYKNDITKIG